MLKEREVRKLNRTSLGLRLCRKLANPGDSRPRDSYKKTPAEKQAFLARHERPIRSG